MIYERSKCVYSLWDEIKKYFNRHKKPIVKRELINYLLWKKNYYSYVSNRREITSIYRYIGMLKKAGYITSDKTHYITLIKIPIDLKVRDCKVIKADGFLKEEDFIL